MMLALLLLLLSSAAQAVDSTVVTSSVGSASRTLVARVTPTGDGYELVGLINDPGGVKQTALWGNGKIIKNCPTSLCTMTWSRTGMKIGVNDVAFLSATPAGVWTVLITRVRRPVLLPTPPSPAPLAVPMP